MKIDDGLYKSFLEEMNALENFRIAYASLHPGVPLDREDPDVRRLIEAMALFSARTRLTGLRQINATNRRIFQQYFPYLLAPLPAMGVLQALPSRQFVEPLFFPKGSEIAVSPESGGTAVFQTLDDLNILPISLSKFSMLLLPDKGFRLTLQLSASFARNEDIGRLRFMINHLNNYEASQRVLYHLKRYLRRAFVVFDEKVTETSSGTAAQVSFGMLPDDEQTGHPLQKERTFFHFPWQELYLNIQIPQTARNWLNFTICLDLAAGWPRNLVLNQDIFQLFTAPIINRRRAMAQPITCDGAQENYTLRHPDLESGFELHSVQGIYEVTKEGMAFVKPGILSGSAPSYETEEQTDSEGRKRHLLKLHFPEAFETSKTIATDAFWYQPWFSERVSQRLSVLPFARSAVGLKWDLPISPVPHAENLFQDSVEGFLHFLALTNRETLNRDDLLDILQAMGLARQRPFQALCDLLAGIRIERAPLQDTRFSGLMKHRYILSFRAYDSSREPLMDVFLAHVENILNAWISDAKIEVQKEAAGRATGQT